MNNKTHYWIWLSYDLKNCTDLGCYYPPWPDSTHPHSITKLLQIKVCPDKVQLNKLNIALHLLVSIKRRVIIINFMANQMPTCYLLHRLHFLNLETSKTTNCQLHVWRLFAHRKNYSSNGLNTHGLSGCQQILILLITIMCYWYFIYWRKATEYTNQYKYCHLTGKLIINPVCGMIKRSAGSWAHNTSCQSAIPWIIIIK